MPRNPDGTYELPAGNPVVSGTVISADNWANPTMGDVAAALADSLSRTGNGGMLQPFKAVDGSEATPGIAFNLDADTGIRRVADDIMALVAGGVDVAVIAQAGFSWLVNLVIQYTKSLDFQNSAGNLDDVGAYRFVNSADGLKLQKRNDAGDAWVDAVVIGDADADALMVDMPVVLKQVLNVLGDVGLGGSLNVQFGGSFGGLLNLAYNTGLYLANPLDENTGTDAWRVVNDGNELHFQVNTGTLAVPVWQDAAVFTPTTVTLFGLILGAANIEKAQILAAGGTNPDFGQYFSSSDINYDFDPNDSRVKRIINRVNGGVQGLVIQTADGAGGWVDVLLIPHGAALRYPRNLQPIPFDTSIPGESLAHKAYVDRIGTIQQNIQGYYRYVGNMDSGPVNSIAIEQWGRKAVAAGTTRTVIPFPLNFQGGATPLPTINAVVAIEIDEVVTGPVANTFGAKIVSRSASAIEVEVYQELNIGRGAPTVDYTINWRATGAWD